jgi:hypothetical protein
MRNRLTIAIMLGLLWLTPFNNSIIAQGLKAQQRTQEIVAFFNKSKHVVKEKRGIRVEKFKEIRSEPVIRRDAASYAGTYETDMRYAIQIRVGSDGRVEAEGTEPAANQESLKYTLKNAKLEGALLTGTKVFENGTTEKFEGVFINLTERDSPTESGVTTFGLGVLYDPPKTNPELGFSITRLFYQQKP